MTRTLVALLLAALPLTAAPVPKAAKRADDGKAILGRWSGAVEGQGNQTGYTFRFSDDGTCGITHTKGQETPAEYTLDPSGTPKRMRWLNGKERTEWRCVYELDGDTLKVGFVHQGTEIPADLAPRGGVTVYVLKRATDDK